MSSISDIPTPAQGGLVCQQSLFHLTPLFVFVHANIARKTSRGETKYDFSEELHVGEEPCRLVGGHIVALGSHDLRHDNKCTMSILPG